MVQGPHTHREELTSGMRMLRYMHSGRNHVRTVMHLETGCRPSPRLAQNRGKKPEPAPIAGKKRPGQSRRWVMTNKSIVTAPSCTDQGYTTHTCTRCGNSYIDAYVELWDMTGNLRRLGSLQKQKVATGSTLVNGVTRPDERRFLPSALSPQTRSLRRIHLWMWKRGGSIMNRCFGLWRKESHLG